MIKNKDMESCIIVIIQWHMKDSGNRICLMEKDIHMILKEIKCSKILY